MSLSVKNLDHVINNKPLLQDVSLQIDEAKVIGIIGPNGAGKSTLLKCLSGLIATENSIQFNGQPLESLDPRTLSKMRAALPQESNLNFPFPVKDVVGMSFALSSVGIEQQEHLINHCLTMVSAQGLAGRNFLSLSGGEKQRVHLARVFAQLLHLGSTHGMRFLFLDEPTAPLDMKHQFQLFGQIRALVKENIASIVVIHDINLAASYCDEIWVIQDGRLVSQQTPKQVISKDMMKSVFDVDVEVMHCGNDARPVINNPNYETI